jgi:hypothetical protein
MTQILISKIFDKEIVFESSVLAWIRIRYWIHIRIRIESIRIHNPDLNKYIIFSIIFEVPYASTSSTILILSLKYFGAVILF